MRLPCSRKGSRGFTLVEVVIALGVAAVVLVPMVALLSSASTGAARVITQDQARQLEAVVREKLELAEFDDVYRWVRTQRPLWVYAYRASSEPRPDGTARAVRWEGIGTETHTATVTRSEDELDVLADDLTALEGRLFLVDLSLSERNRIEQLPESPKRYASPSLTVNATFSVVRHASGYLESEFEPQFVRTLAIFR